MNKTPKDDEGLTVTHHDGTVSKLVFRKDIKAIDCYAPEPTDSPETRKAHIKLFGLTHGT